jgi:hypothetical protein
LCITDYAIDGGSVRWSLGARPFEQVGISRHEAQILILGLVESYTFHVSYLLKTHLAFKVRGIRE